MSEEKGYTINDRRGLNKGQEEPNEVCRVCGSQEVHSKEYGKPTMECIEYLRKRIVDLEFQLEQEGLLPDPTVEPPQFDRVDEAYK